MSQTTPRVQPVGLQKLCEITEKQRKDIKEMLDAGYYDFNERNLYGVGGNQDLAETLGAEDKAIVRESLRAIPLKEFFAASGTSGIQGGAYLLPDKTYQIMYDSAVDTDLCAQAGMMIGPDGIPGSSLKINVQVDNTYNPIIYSSGGDLPYMAMQIVQATLTPVQFGMRIGITNDMIEDAAYDVMEMHIRNAGREMGEAATDQLCTVLKSPPDGDGTVNSSATGDANETKFSGGATADLLDALDGNAQDGFVSNKVITTYGALWHSLISTLPNYAEPLQAEFLRAGKITSICGCDFMYTQCSSMTNSKAGDNLVTLVFDNRYSHVTGRKRWLRMDDYSDPVKDLKGAVVSARQDVVTLYKDSIFVLTET